MDCTDDLYGLFTKSFLVSVRFIVSLLLCCKNFVLFCFVLCVRRAKLYLFSFWMLTQLAFRVFLPAKVNYFLFFVVLCSSSNFFHIAFRWLFATRRRSSRLSPQRSGGVDRDDAALSGRSQRRPARLGSRRGRSARLCHAVSARCVHRVGAVGRARASRQRRRTQVCECVCACTILFLSLKRLHCSFLLLSC